MRLFDYEMTAKSLINNDVANMLSRIHEYKGEQNLFIEAKADILTSLLEIARVQSTEASNRIEGIYTSDQRIAEIVKQKSEPRNRNENEIAGYRDVLATIHESYDFIPLKSSILLQLHRDLYKYSSLSIGGNFKNSDNVIEERDALGNKSVRFQPVPAAFTKETVECICEEYNRTAAKSEIDPLLLIPIFILDFLCIHPFNDGNGRMSRLLTLLLLYRSGYIVGKYISIEMLIEKSKDTYYDVLQASSNGWHEAESDYAPFVTYTLGVILKAYREFASRVEFLTTKGVSKPDRVEITIKEHLGKINKKQILELCPDISESTAEHTLRRLLNENKIIKLGGGRGSAYIYNHEKE